MSKLAGLLTTLAAFAAPLTLTSAAPAATKDDCSARLQSALGHIDYGITKSGNVFHFGAALAGATTDLATAEMNECSGQASTVRTAIAKALRDVQTAGPRSRAGWKAARANVTVALEYLGVPVRPYRLCDNVPRCESVGPPASAAAKARGRSARR